MINPFLIWRNLLNNYINYIDTGIPIRSKYYSQRRKEILAKGHALMQEPYIELIRKYEGLMSINEYCEKRGLDHDIADFLAMTLCKGRKLYKHQIAALDAVLINKKSAVITTGTGSGKTESFLMPILASLVEESKDWDCTRQPAIRTLILYPLNALAEDQMVRLRKTLESEDVKRWLDINRNQSRFFFGRYTSATYHERDNEYNAAEKEWKKFKELEESEDIDQEMLSEYRYHLQNFDEDSIEIKTRESMQARCPDIFITNYSMLNVLLMRKDDVDSIFEDTKKWLLASESNQLTIVLDELHTYRGTAGTEVSYLLRTLLDRLGIADKPSKVRFIASSASMNPDDENTWTYLSDFFYTDAKNTFDLIHDDSEEIIDSSVLPKLPLTDLVELGKQCRICKSQNETEELISNYINKLGFERPLQFCEQYSLKSWFSYVIGYQGGKRASIIAKEMFKDLNESDALFALEGVVCVFNSALENNSAIQPMRAHIFARNIDHMYICSNPECSELPNEALLDSERKFGQLYATPKLRCKCGSLIYEAAVCRSCGEIFPYGYLESDGENSIVVQSSADLDPESILFYSSKERIYEEKKSGEDVWSPDFSLNVYTGEVKKSRTGNLMLWRDMQKTKFSRYCPQCEYQMSGSSDKTIIYQHGTGVQKVNQIFADYLMEEIRKEHPENGPKLVLFSDSRQSAAKLSAGIELDHYRDALRVAVNQSLKNESPNQSLLQNYYKTGNNTLVQGFPFFSKKEKEIIKIISTLYILGVDLLDEEDKKTLDDYFAQEGIVIDSISTKVQELLIEHGINPAGPYPSIQNVDSNSEDSERWYELLNEKNVMVSNGNTINRFFIEDKFNPKILNEILSVIFKNQNLSFESLGLGKVVPIIPKEKSENYDIELLEVVIRLLGESNRIQMDDCYHYYDSDSYPSRVNQFFGILFGKDKIKKRKETFEQLRDLKIIGKRGNCKSQIS